MDPVPAGRPRDAAPPAASPASRGAGAGRFAAALRELWLAAGKPSYRSISGRLHALSTYQYRNVSGGRRLTDVHVQHFPSPDQASIFFSSTAKSGYGPWNGPEASPRD